MMTSLEMQTIEVLVVEDDAADRRLIKLLLARCPGTLRFQVTTAATLREAAACLSSERYSVILLDLGLPDSNGLSTIQAIHDADPSVPIVVLTGLDDEDLGLEAIKWGAGDYLVKGNSLEHLLIRTIRYAIERKRAAREWERTFNSISDAIFIVDNESRIVKANNAFRRTFGERTPDCIIQKCHEAVQSEQGSRASIPVAGGACSAMTEILDPALDTPFLVTASPLWDDAGRPSGIVYVAKDISEIKKAQRQMQEAMEVKSQFVSMASHELRTPLTAIKESIDIVSQGAGQKLDAEMSQFLGLAKRNIDRLSRLINDVLDIQKLDSGRIEFHMQESDINETVKEVVVSMAPLARQKGLKLALSLIDRPPVARFDRDRITQVLMNLINNAVKFTDAGTITVATRLEGRTITTTVSDTGPGIRKEDFPKLFQKFQQLGGPSQRKPGGTGLGLAICKQIVERHAGKIWVDSEPGAGAQFSFLLPLEETAMRDSGTTLNADDESAHLLHSVQTTVNGGK